MLNKTRTLGAIAGLFGGALMLAGCGQPAAAPVPSQGGVTTPSPDAGIAPGETAQPAVGGGSDSSAEGSSEQQTPTSECAASDLKVDLNVQPDRPGILLMAVTNQSEQDCHFSGWATVAPVDMSGAAHDVPVQKVEIPGGPTDVTINPGETAFAGVQFTRGDKADPDTVVATGFNVTMPGLDSPITANIIGTDGTTVGENGSYAQFPVKSLQVGTLQPVAQGVTVF